MSSDLSLVSQAVVDELDRIGIKAASVRVTALDGSGVAFTVEIVSHTFEGQTYLDREMRARPAVARAFGAHGMARSTFVIDAQTPDEGQAGSPLPEEATETGDVQQDVANRRAWREQQAAIVRALKASRYDLSQLDEGVFVATRTLLAEESILIGFATSTNSKTVDLGIRRTMQTARSSQRFQAHFYISPEELPSPFANQTAADWLSLHTTISFLHLLNSSQALARALRNTDTSAPSQVLSAPGRVIDPDIKLQSGELLTEGFFQHVEQWCAGPRASLLVLLAPAGHGKTTLANELTRRMAHRFAEDASHTPVPLLVPFESVRRTVDFDALMHKRLAELHGGAPGAFLELLKVNRAVLVVDGFDELADDAGLGAAENQVRSMKPLFEGRAKAILAGRSLFAQQFAGSQSIKDRVRSLLGDIDVQILEIVPFSREKIEEYVASRDTLTETQRTRVLGFADASPDHLDLCSNPLFLRILCSLAGADKLPSDKEVAASVNVLVDRVCEREEDRQHLSIGVQGQLDFLGWIATDLFRMGAVALPAADVSFIAGAIAEDKGSGDNELVGRLADHALLVPASREMTSFIHPFFRDVILGRAIESTAAATRALPATLQERDLPEGTVQYLAHANGNVTRLLPRNWLSDPSSAPTKSRRNLYRIVREEAQHKTDGNPREWVQDAWLSGRMVRALNLSSMILESTSFDGLTLSGMDLSSSLAEDCDFRGTRFVNCDLAFSTFINCRFDDATTIEESTVTETEVRVDAKSFTASTAVDLVAAMRAGAERRPVTAGPSVDAALIARDLLSGVLVQLVDRDGVRFHARSIRTLRPVGRDAREQTATERVVAPMVLRTLCDTELAAGSKEMATISKRWRKAVADFVREKRMTPSLEEFAAKVATRAARFLE